MITRNTVFVLGAGASKPYGFPLGFELFGRVGDRSNLINALKHSSEQMQRDISENEVAKFCSVVQSCGLMSIDKLLERRPNLEEIGKFAIASVLIPCEDPANLFNMDGPNWYRFLYKAMEGELSGHFSSNRVCFITFNYDRSLEHFFTCALRDTYGLVPDAAVEQMREVKIIHVHGLLGDYEHASRRGREYSQELSQYTLNKARERIRIISKGKEDSDDLNKARIHLKQAELVVFIGFGFDVDNMRLLRSQEWQGANQEIIAGCYRMSHIERENAHKQFHIHNLKFVDKDALSLIREDVWLT